MVLAILLEREKISDSRKSRDSTLQEQRPKTFPASCPHELRLTASHLFISLTHHHAIRGILALFLFLPASDKPLVDEAAQRGYLKPLPHRLITPLVPVPDGFCAQSMVEDVELTNFQRIHGCPSPKPQGDRLRRLVMAVSPSSRLVMVIGG